jgi:gentisate 1,2-dioxygenase
MALRNQRIGGRADAPAEHPRRFPRHRSRDTHDSDGGPMPTPAPAGDWSSAARFYEYTKAADPAVPPIPYDVFPAGRHQDGATRVIPWDLSSRIACAWPATSPALLASFVRIRAGESLTTAAAASSQLFYAIRGAGRTRVAGRDLTWSAGDLFTLPSAPEVEHAASADAALYWVSDEPLLRYLGVKPDQPRFAPTLYRREAMLAELARVRAEPGAERRNRMGIILGNADTAQTMTVTHLLWSLLNVLPAGAVQKPHRHNSVALDLCVSASPGTYTLIADEVDAAGALIDPIRAEWQPGAAFVTPPGLWHSHHNESRDEALVLPIQDAGLHTWMRTLDIRFVR